MSTIAIVGGGIGGIVAAFTLKKAHPKHDVVVIEASPNLGGLLGVSHQIGGLSFDIGTHIPAETMIDELDEWLFGALYEDDVWQKITRISGGNYYDGQLDENHHNILSRSTYDDLDDNVKLPEKEINCVDDYLFRFGKYLTNNVFLPSLAKFIPCDAEKLEPEVQRYFALDRLSQHSGSTSPNTRLENSRIHPQGKKIPTAFYTSNGKGVSDWIAHLKVQLEQLGVKFLHGKKTVGFEVDNHKIEKLNFDDSSTFTCNQVIWSAPIETLLPLVSQQSSENFSKYYQRTKIKLFHFVFDIPYLTLCHYVNCFDTHVDPYRVTLYENFSGRNDKQKSYRCTVEVIGERAQNPNLDEADIFRQLVEMGIVSADTKVMSSHETQVLNGFPIKHLGALSNARELCSEVTDMFKNIHLVGSAEPSTFFSNDVMIRTFTSLQAKLEEGKIT
ncbi:NAD(P)-binding protein [Alteromonas sp. K632G]|jgi:protoporphyrinogen oxidase|uniref:NAD(P)-binding protein n=1 Tax=Alteromonas sp. K632G TaxID=2820757 RepID=UPI000C5DE7F9|nr:NAD(P)-binding protein [Alteromonas sp. K632G]MBB67118.1 hypothetical protein [Rickettsiales bacterium]MBO7920745.1 NAD(P)-binding protein [Alteromonas sp. K632G]|tara:strand:+ start:8972 stop:10303 length:1332 start_codon:yes stop_codon:yes gene_type:complete